MQNFELACGDGLKHSHAILIIFLFFHVEVKYRSVFESEQIRLCKSQFYLIFPSNNTNILLFLKCVSLYGIAVMQP